MVAVAVE